MAMDENTQSLLKAEQVGLAFKAYSNALQMALVDFQYIEECLRLYIYVSYDFIRHKVSDTIPFKFDIPDLEKDALGKLIEKYSKFSNNDILISELRNLLPERNKIAHRGLLLSHKEQNDVAHLDEQTKRLTELHQRLRPHIQTLLNERAKLTGEPQVAI